MKRLPIYGLLITGYIIIVLGVYQLYNGLLKVESINIPASEETVTRLGIVPSIMLAVFVVIVTSSLGVYLLTELWKYFVAHKTLLPIPFLLIALGFVNLSIKVMDGVRVMIDTNSQTFTDNLTEYIDAFQMLGTHTLWGIICVVLSAVYSVLLKHNII